MKFEKINESHLKFSLTYEDIASRGFHQEELWLNKEKGEEFVWTIIDEVDEIDNFDENEPIFIQVLVSEKGIDMIVTQDNNSNIVNHLFKSTINHHIENLSDNIKEELSHYIDNTEKNSSKKHVNTSRKAMKANLIIKFKTLDDLIDYSHYQTLSNVIMNDLLYEWDEHYYYYVNFDLHHLSPYLLTQFIAQSSEFGNIVQLDLSVLEEYGTLILKNNVIQTFNENFNK